MIFMEEIVRSYMHEIAEEMGEALRRTGYSPNIKERKDFSCAIFDADGCMVSQAEHLPVHLGSMIFSVRQVVSELSLEEGDVAILNDPYRGGTHLPDITMVAPSPDFGYIANRAHHSDVGGSAPGSMAGNARDIFAEGLRIPPTKLYEGGSLDHDTLSFILANVRTPSERKGDLLAQYSAIKTGLRRMEELMKKYGKEAVRDVAHRTLAYSEKRARLEIKKIPGGEFSFCDCMEDGEDLKKIKVSIRRRGDSLLFDFSGTDPQTDAPINAVFPVTVSSVYYVFRCITNPTIPPNSGLYRPLEIKAPAGCLLNPLPPAPVAGGNVETSQRIVDVCLGALAKAMPHLIPAASCGSMNNMSIGGVYGGTPYAYYETIGGGMGARPTIHGIDAIHTHMTNTQNTPIEAQEMALPIRVEEYGIRNGSGGMGKFKGGRGIRKGICLLSGTATLSLLSERHKVAPYGLRGGQTGRRAKAYVVRDGKKIVVSSKSTVTLVERDRFYIETAGGGGWGRKSRKKI